MAFFFGITRWKNSTLVPSVRYKSSIFIWDACIIAAIWRPNSIRFFCVPIVIILFLPKKMKIGNFCHANYWAKLNATKCNQVQSYTCSNYTYFGKIRLIAGSLNISLWNCCYTWLFIAFSVEKIEQMTNGVISVEKTSMWLTLWFLVKKTGMRLTVWFLVEKTGMWLWVRFKSMRSMKG